jgi:hypothetical protein
MREQALHMINSIHRKWRATRFVSHVLLAVAVILPPVFVVWHYTGQVVWPATVFFIVAATVVSVLDRPWRITDKEVARFLNSAYPLLEESCELLLRERSSLNLLEQLQAAKTAEALLEIEPPVLYKGLYRPLLGIVFSVLFCGLVWLAIGLFNTGNRPSPINAIPGARVSMPVGVSDIMIRIIPPSYTHKPARRQQAMNLETEEGAAVQWTIKLQRPANEVTFIYNDSLVVVLKSDASKINWTTDKKIEHAGFYQMKIDTVVSELYRIEVKTDQPPLISISSPKPNTMIEYGEPERVNILANVSDDYGVKDVVINATVARGSGEGVTFKAQKISFGVSFSEQRLQYALQKMIGLRALGMEPGDELYFYLSATDNHEQEKRSDIYIVTIIDTAKLMGLEGLLNGVNLKPDYFRSQRQIILDAEQLLRDRDTTSQENFNNRSNNLGIDQKLLRLRYGKFLGEEATSNESIAGADLGAAADFGNAGVILDAFTDHHDNAEDATFLDPETKKQLKATLTEMWNAELQLRLFKPREALPYAYKALRLLKDLQQKSRVYVAKTNIKTAPIKLEKRLTGKLEKIIEPITSNRITPAEDVAAGIRNALPVLETLKKENIADEKSIQLLRLAAAQLNNYAAKEPALYLGGLESMKKIITAVQNKKYLSPADIFTVEKALQKMAGAPALLPSKKRTLPGWSLQDAYFRNLQKNNH